MATKSTKKSSNRSGKTAQRKATNRTGTEPPRRSVADHSEHPESPGDSTVRHAGRGSFPQGEYDVTSPKKSDGKKQSIKDTLLEQHSAASSGNTDTVLELLKHRSANRLQAHERELAYETLPVGVVIEHDRAYSWKIHVLGQARFSFGATLKEAIDAWVLGNTDVNGAQAAARRFKELPASQQKEIEERDNAAARSVGQGAADSPDVIARREALKFSEAADKRAPSPTNANSDGAEVSSATNRAGRGEDPAGESDARSSARARANARRRKGARAKAGKSR